MPDKRNNVSLLLAWGTGLFFSQSALVQGQLVAEAEAAARGAVAAIAVWLENDASLFPTPQSASPVPFLSTHYYPYPLI